MVAANRSLLALLVATNVLGQNTPAIAATEAHYGEMWAQDAAAMYGYASASATAAQVTPFSTPPQTTNPGGLTAQAAATAQAAGTPAGTDAETLMSSAPQLISGMPQTLQGLASPQSLAGLTSTATDTTSSTSSSSTSSLSELSALSTPLRMATMPMSMLSKLFTAGSTANAARTVSNAANELGAVQSAGLGSGTGTVTLTGIGAGSPAISAGMGQATSVGPLSVPSAWGSSASVASPAAALPFTGAGAVPAAHAGTTAGMPPMMPVTNLAGRDGAATPSRFEMRSTVIPFSPAAG
jgi:PPE-repeat protein